VNISEIGFGNQCIRFATGSFCKCVPINNVRTKRTNRMYIVAAGHSIVRKIRHTTFTLVYNASNRDDLKKKNVIYYDLYKS